MCLALFFNNNKNKMSNRGNKKISNNSLKQDITLMTLLANESTSDSRKLLKKYGVGDASNHKDLEVKLAELYFNTPDKIQMEKELASIHPHLKWILKYYPQIKEEVKVEPSEDEAMKTIKSEIISNADGDCGCNKSNFDSANMPNTQRLINPMEYIAFISVVGLIGLTFYAISKNK